MQRSSKNILRVLRIIFAIFIFVPILLFFVDFADILPYKLNRLLQVQLIPAAFTGATVILIILFLLTLFFGRIYCSVFCPAGILQDIMNRIACIGKKKKKGKMRFSYHKPVNWLRYGLLTITVALALFGITWLCMLLDPYSNFGRIATNIFRPAVIRVNNIMAEVLTSMGNYTLYNESVHISTTAFVSALIVFLIFSVMVYFRGRLFCNTICPVGALLSLVSRYSFFRITFNEELCNNCRSCEYSCKAEAIDSENMMVDASRCVTCFNCTSACTKNGLKYRFSPLNPFQKASQPQAAIESAAVSESRRSFIACGAVLAGSAPLLAIAKQNDRQNDICGGCNRDSCEFCGRLDMPVTPPGSLSIERFTDLCTACHLCVVKCPTKILKPSGFEYGLEYMLKPHMSYTDKFCNYSCKACSEVCPTDAITPVTLEEKQVAQIGVAHFDIDICIVKTEKNDCGACSEHCPTQAVHMIPYEGTLTIPKVEPDLCIGCGGCESICPVRPVRAIVIVPNTVHQTVEKPEEEEVQDFEVDGFGF